MDAFDQMSVDQQKRHLAYYEDSSQMVENYIRTTAQMHKHDPDLYKPCKVTFDYRARTFFGGKETKEFVKFVSFLVS
jgi:hypothetical protein